jgi:Domain of unknown function (DUF3943)
MSSLRVVLVAIVTCVASPDGASGQTFVQANQNDHRPCDGCPPRRVGRALIVVTFVNGIYELANLVRGQDTAKITPKTWWTNMKRGWEWDLDDFAVNQIGHPYQGNNYFTTGRANGLNFWESSALTAFGSGTWEYFGETNQASLNDFINTTLGGIALGEMFHRTAWLVRNPTKTGKSRLMSEIGAMALDPVSGATRFISGDAERVTQKPSDMIPSALAGEASLGALWRGSNTETIKSNTYAFFETDLLYGTLESGSSHTPYDAFAVRLSFGGGTAFSEARVRGRLFSARAGRALFTISQGYQYNNNPAYQFGAQSFDGMFSGQRAVTSHTSLLAAGWGGATILGAVDSIPIASTVVPEGEEDAGQGVSTGPRNYDYGPGGNLGAFLVLRHDTRQVLTFSWELHHLHVLDGVRANHVLQRARLDFAWPLRGSLGVGTSFEYFDRHTYYNDKTVDDAHFHFPQARVFLTWAIR